MTQRVARLVSIAGHPAITMPLAAALASAAAGPALAVTAVALAATTGLLVLGYGYYKTRRGDWAHIDASGKQERAQLNTRAGLGLAVAAAGLAASPVHWAITLAVALCAAIVGVAHLLRGRTKLSLHLAFAVFAAFIVWPHYLATLAFLLAIPAIGWSRLVLGRHVGGDLAWGAGVGALAGAAWMAAMMSRSP